MVHGDADARGEVLGEDDDVAFARGSDALERLEGLLGVLRDLARDTGLPEAQHGVFVRDDVVTHG
jgi:hypothetical protein